MRHDAAVSELIGAVLLIAVVIAGMGMVAVLMLSTPPPENLPKTSISAYCVECTRDSNYEIIIYHGGGEKLERNKLEFYLKTEANPMGEEIVPFLVYNDVPNYCGAEFGDSSLFGNERWSSSDYWVSGQTLRFFHTANNVGDRPIGIYLRHWPYHSNIAAADFSRLRYGPEDWNPDYNYKKGIVDESKLPPYCLELMPIYLETRKKADGTCEADFTYIYDSGPDEFQIQTEFLSWNGFIGTDIAEDQGQTTWFSLENSEVYVITVPFTKDVQWKLGRSISEKAVCT